MDIDAEKLLCLVKSRSTIYNYRDKDHSNKNKVERLWNEIATELNCEVLECKGKWTSLRNSYSRYLRGERKPSGCSGKQKKKYYLADAMSFVKDFIKLQHNTSSSLETEELDDSEIFQVDSLATPKQFESTQSNSPISRKKPKMSVWSDTVAGPMTEFLESKTKPKEKDNSAALLFQSLLLDYEKLSSKRQRAFRWHMVNKMIDLQEEEENEAAKITVETDEHENTNPLA